MNNKTMTSAEAILRDRKKRGARNVLLLCLAILVVAGVVGVFHLPATAKTYQKWVLTCPAEAPAGPGYAGFFLHTHNDDCFDESGNLVCPLPEIKAHVHDDNCFVVSRELDCAISESDGHQHTAECYTRVRGDLTCTLSTEPVLDEKGNVIEEGHVHTDECYAWHEELSCGKEAGEGAHHHDENCYRTVTTLTCDKAEIIPHVHTDACLQKNEDGSVYVDESGNTLLICGLQELTEHVHGPECFTVYELDDGVPEETEETPIVTTESETGSETETVTETETETEIVTVTETEIETETVTEIEPETETVTEETPAAEGSEETGDGFIFLYPEEDENVTETVTETETETVIGTEDTDPENADETETVVTEAADEVNTEQENRETDPADSQETEEKENTEEDNEEENSEDKETPEDEQETEETGESEETPEAVPTRQLGGEKGGATVLAEVPEPLLGETARLSLDDYSADDARAAILSAVNENAAEGEEREIISIYVIDIGLDVNGEPVIPEGETPIRFTIRAKEIRGMTAPKVYQLISGTAVRIEEADFDPEAGTVSFTATGFSAFAIADLTGEDPVDEEPEETPVSVSMPAQTFSGETEDVVVSVTAPEGAFPEGTTMEVKMVELDDETMSSVEKAVEGKVTTVQAVDITFYDAEGNKIEPQTAIQVSMKSAVVSESENVSLIHKPDAVETDDPEAEAPALEVVEAAIVEQEDAAAPSDEITFESNAFSVYMLVGTETITTRYLTADGETYLITLTYGPEAMIPEGAGLAVSEIPQDSEEYATYLAQAQNAVNANTPVETDPAETKGTDAESEAESPESSAGGAAGRVTVTTARFFDITILDAEGNPVEPAAPVDVKIEYMEPAETAENYQVVHFGEETEVLNPAVSGADGTASAFDFKANSFSVFGIVGTKVIEADVLLSDGNLYTVSVIYDESAHIPSGSSLRVVPFEEGTPEYEYARNSVLADRKARGEWVDLSSFGLAALDISILNPDGEEIEPEAPVQVEVRIKELPGVESLDEIAETLAIQHHVEVEDGVVVETVFNGTAQASFRMETNQTVAAEGTVVDPNSVNIEDFENRELFNESVTVSFETEKFSTFTVTWRPRGSMSNRSTTVHYGYMDGGTFREFDAQPSPVDIASDSRAYLIYDFDGYQYSGYTYYLTNASSTPAADGTRIQALLRYNNGWQYRNYSTETGGRWSDIANNGHIYVVYEPETAIPQGGTPVAKKTEDFQYPAEPDIYKKSSDNHDGTRTLSLSVTGHTEELEVEKLADVIVVFDNSGSMKEDMAGKDTYYDSQRRLTIAKNAVNAMARTLLSKVNSSGGKLIRMSLISFNDYATVNQEFTEDYTIFSSAVNDLDAENGTNWEHALKLANQMAVDSERATFVIFVSDGDPTSRVTRMNATDAELDIYKKGTDPDYLSIYHIFGTGSTDPYGYNYDTALNEAISIVQHNKNFYTIAISNDVSNMVRLSNEAGGNGNYTATTSTELEEAFDDIAASIIALMGHSDVKISDGITALTQTVQKSTLVNFAEDDFTYYKGKVVVATQADVDAERAAKVGDPIPATQADVDAGLAEKVGGTKVESWESWTPSSEGCANAVYNTTTGAVEWNMGEGFMLEDGYTYQVRFKVWPSQQAYDLLADLNNGVKSYDSLSDAEKAQIKEPTTVGGMYTLKTNSDTSYTYREATKTGDTVTPTGEPSAPQHFPDVDPLELTTKPLRVMKQWHNNYVDSRALTDHITMELYGVDPDGVTSHDFKEITLSKDGGWYAENNYVSYGLVTYNTSTDSGAKIYETGHDFTLREIDDEAHYYELAAGVFRPMFINGTPTILEKVDAAPAGMSDSVFHYSDGSHHYYRLDGKIYRDTQSDILLIATNSHRSYMDLKKVVVDETGAATVDDAEFEYKITFTVPSGIDNYDTLEKYIWFNVYDNVAGRTLAPSEYTHSGVITPAQENPQFSGPEYAKYLVAISGQQMALKIKQGWNVRFLNLPIGTTYSFEETSIPEDYNFVKAEVSGTRWIANMVDGKDQGSAVNMTGLPSNISGSNSNTSIRGTIDFANAQYNTTYTNKTLTQHVKILKATQNGTIPLPGAEFSLYTESGYNVNPKKAAKTGLTSGPDGMIDLKALACGTYYLVETKAPDGYNMLTGPVIISVTGAGVSSTQSDYQGNKPVNAEPITVSNPNDETTDTYYTVIVNNNPGVELPQTGGAGTLHLRYLGMTVMLGAALLLMARQRQKKES